MLINFETFNKQVKGLLMFSFTFKMGQNVPLPILQKRPCQQHFGRQEKLFQILCLLWAQCNQP